MYPVGQSVSCQSVVTRCSRQEHAQMDSFGVPAAHGGLLRDAEAAVGGFSAHLHGRFQVRVGTGCREEMAAVNL